jgi:V-type H+-transporting ATPase subunit G
MEEDAAKDTETKIADIKKTGKGKGNKVVEDLLKAVMEVKPEVPDNLKS